MRVFTLNFPLFDNEGRDLSPVHENLQWVLCKVAGGFTMSGNQTGGWLNPDTGAVQIEPVNVYRVAFDGDAAPLLSLARQFGVACEQHSVYVEIDGAPMVLDLGALRKAK